MVSWDSWLDSLANTDIKANIIKERSGIFTRDGVACAVGKNCPFTPKEVVSIVEGITKNDTATARTIGGKKYICLRKIDDDTMILKGQGEEVCVSIGSQYVVVSITLPEAKINNGINQIVNTKSALHPK